MRHTAPLLLLLLVAVGCPGGEPPAALVKTAHAQNKPAPPPAPAALALRPRLEKGTTWSQTVKVTTDWSMGSGGMRGRFDLTMTGRIVEGKDGQPAKIAFNAIRGWQSFARYSGGTETEPEKRETKNGSIVSDLDESLSLVNFKDIAMSDDVLLVWPPGPFFGFVPPEHAVKVGETWDSKGVVPVGPKTLRKRQLTFSEPKGQFKLVKADTVAEIEWTGSAKVREKRRGDGQATWVRTVRFDLARKRVVSSVGVLTMDFGSMKITHDVSVKSD